MPAFQSRFLGTHFLNPPRYLKLLEVVPVLPGSEPVVDGFTRWAEAVLGHRVVRARDTPGFISTRVGIRHLLDCLHLALELGLTPEEADAVTGAFLGRPRTGTFRLADVVGLDIVAAIGEDMHSRLPNDPQREHWLPPAIVTQLMAQGRVGDKSGGGFYAKRDGQSLVLDTQKGNDRPLARPAISELDALLALPLPERLAALSSVPDAPWLRYAVAVLDALAGYVNAVGPAIADNPADIDRVMQWGFGWELGPFAMEAARGAAPPAPQVWGRTLYSPFPLHLFREAWCEAKKATWNLLPPDLGGRGGVCHPRRRAGCGRAYP